MPLPEALPAQPAAGGDAVTPTASLPDPWWTIFGDPTLDALIDEALAHNTDVAVAAARVAEARAQARDRRVRIACRRSTSRRARARSRDKRDPPAGAGRTRDLERVLRRAAA